MNKWKTGLDHLCAHNRLNWNGRISGEWWDEWDDSILQTQDSKFVPWQSDAQHATSRASREEPFCFFSDFPNMQLQPLQQGPQLQKGENLNYLFWRCKDWYQIQMSQEMINLFVVETQ